MIPFQAPCASDNTFDPLELARKTESIVMQGKKRKYLRFGITPDYGSGVATAYGLGCNLRCVFCWANETRDNLDIGKDFYSPQEVFSHLSEIIHRNPKIDKMRISNCEPTIGKEHLLEMAELMEKSDHKLFIIETNGIILGQDEGFAKELSKFKKSYVRVGLRAGNAEEFTRKTGAVPESFMLPFQAIRHLKEHKARFSVAAMSADPRFMLPTERVSLIVRLGEIDPDLVLKLEEEVIYLDPVAKRLLDKRGWDTRHARLPRFFKGFLNKYLQISYKPIASLAQRKVSIKYTLMNFFKLRHGV